MHSGVWHGNGIHSHGRENTMTTETLNFPVFHSEQGIKSDQVQFFLDGSIKDLDKATDLQLAKSAGHNDMGAFEEIYKRHHRRVYSVCLRMLQNTSEAEDLTQDTFIQLYRKIGSFRGDSAFTTWLHRMTVNQVLMHFRKRSVKYEKTTEEGETPDQIVSGTSSQKVYAGIGLSAIGLETHLNPAIFFFYLLRRYLAAGPCKFRLHSIFYGRVLSGNRSQVEIGD